MKHLYLVFVAVVVLFFWRFFISGMIPFPGDTVIGSYYPWLNSKWGFSTGVAVKNPLMSDVISQMYPWRYIAIQDIKHGQLPLWDPYSFAGETLIGNIQAGIFNPFNILFFLGLSFNFAWGLQVVLQPLLAMIAMSFLLRQYKLSKYSILLGSLCYGFSAPLIMWSEYNVNGFTMAIFPLYIYCIESNRLIWISLLVALGIFFGYPQLLYYSLGFAFLYLIISSKFNLRQIIYFFSSAILGLGISAIQLLPAQETLKDSIRDVDLVAQGNGLIYMPFKNLLMAVIPDYFGNPATYNFWGGSSYESFCSYSSIVGLFFAIKGIFSANKKLSYTLLSFIVIVILLALNTPLSWTVQQLKFLGLHGSIGARSLFIYSFSVSVLAAFGIEQVKRFSIKDLILPVAVLIIILVTGYLYNISKSPHLMIGLRNSIWPSAILLTTIISYLIVIKFGKKFLFTFSLILIIDVFHFGWKYLPFIKSDLIYPPTPSLSYLENNPQPYRIAIERSEILPANFWTVYNIQSLSGYNILLPHSSSDYLSVLNSGRFDLENSRVIDIKNFNSPLLDLANTKYILVLKRKDGAPNSEGGINPEFNNKKYQSVFEEGPVVILENKDLLPRINTYDSYTVSNSSREALTKLNSADFKLPNQIILNQNINQKDLSKCQTNLDYYNGQEYQLTASCPKNSLLFIADTYTNGWKAKINNQPTNIYQADGNFLATELPQGSSKINIYYSPTSFKYGAIISLLSLIFLILVSTKDELTLKLLKRKLNSK